MSGWGSDRPKEEPCMSCGEETAIGSVFFSDRKEGQAPDGTKFYVCSECRKRVDPNDTQVNLDDPDFYEKLRAAGSFAAQNMGYGIG